MSIIFFPFIVKKISFLLTSLEFISALLELNFLIDKFELEISLITFIFKLFDKFFYFYK